MKQSIETRAVHSGDRKKAPPATPVATPIYTAASFYYDEVETIDRIYGGREPGFAYTRYDNPTIAALEELMTDLEGGEHSLACSSGMSALHLGLMSALKDRPARILCAEAIYGATVRLLNTVFAVQGVEVRFGDIFDLGVLEAELASFQPSILLIESISNPTLRVAAVDRIASLCQRYGVTLMVDNTFATPLLIRPLELGADYSIHSVTKFLAGHGDVVGGMITTRAGFFPYLKQLSKTCGQILGPFEAYLTMRGIKTLALRVERQCQNAHAIAKTLSQHPKVGKVNYPGDPAHPDAEVVARLLPGGLYCPLVSFEIPGAGWPGICAMIDRLKLIVPATSLGDVHSLLLYPVMASHRDLTQEQKERLGINEDLVRLSAGIEAVDDIVADLVQAIG
jgi:cystathionine gamma-synthase/methionine-gamma-lyase